MSNLKRGNKETQFTSERQPSGEAKSEGHKRKLLLKEISEQLVSGEALSDLKPLARYLGVSENEIDIETLMHLKQIEKAIKEQDKIKKVLFELQEYERDVLYPLATERISIDLDDGVLVNYNKFGGAIKEVKGLNDKKTKEKVRKFDWINTEEIR